jgi:hypothetical protein
VFILTFAVFGGSGKAVDFPVWAGNTQDANGLNIDYCKFNMPFDLVKDSG